MVWHAENTRAYVQSVPEYTGSTRTLFNMCARGAGTNGDVSNVHTETFFHRMLGSSLIENVLLTMNGPYMGYHVLQRFTKETLKFKNRSNTGRSRFLQPSALPEHAVGLQ